MIGLRSLVEPTRANRWVRTLDVRVKVVFLLAAAVLVVLIDAPLTLLGILTVVVALHLASGLPAGKLATAAGIALLTVWGTMLSQALFYASVPRTAVFEIIPRSMPVLGALTGGLRVYKEGLIYGAVQSSRIVTMVGLGLLVCWTTDAGAFLSALVRLRVPYAIAFMTVTALRFLPAVVSEAGVVTAARRMRGYHLRRGRWLRPGRHLVQLMKPIFANAIRRSRALALSVESRAFDPTSQRTTVRSSRLGAPGIAVVALLLISLLLVVAMKLLHWMFMHEIYYSQDLRWLYDFVRTYL
jgi:energy-coupling factor transport system permease protein